MDNDLKHWNEVDVTEFCDTLTNKQIKEWIDRTFCRGATYANGYACIKECAEPKVKTMAKRYFKEFERMTELEFLLKDILKNRE